MLSEVVKLVWSTGTTIAGIFIEKSKSEEIYRYVVPEVQKALRAGAPMTRNDVVNAIKILEKLPPVGAKRRNFSKRYLQRKTDVLALPANPDDLSIAHWW